MADLPSNAKPPVRAAGRPPRKTASRCRPKPNERWVGLIAPSRQRRRLAARGIWSRYCYDAELCRLRDFRQNPDSSLAAVSVFSARLGRFHCGAGLFVSAYPEAGDLREGADIFSAHGRLGLGSFPFATAITRWVRAGVFGPDWTFSLRG
jgi:hypothetical protein